MDLAGTLLSPDQAKVSAEAAGVVRSVLVEIGREVRVGDPLVKLEPRELALALARAESALRQTRAQLGMPDALAGGDTPPPDDQIGSVKNALANREDARANADRAKTLSARGLISPVDMQAADTRLKVAEAAYQSAVDTVRGQKALLQDRRAAYDLAVEKARRRRGARADRRRRLRASGPGRRVHRRAHAGRDDRPGQSAEAADGRAGAARRHHRSRGRRSSSAWSRSATRCSRAKSPTSARRSTRRCGRSRWKRSSTTATCGLKPGFFAKGVILTRRDEGVLAVPDAAVSTLAGVSSVYVVQDGKIAQQTVTLGVRQGNLWEVVEGLKGNETLAASRLNELATGVSVTTGAEGEGGRLRRRRSAGAAVTAAAAASEETRIEAR